MYLYGASGHGKVIKEILEGSGRKVDGFIDDNPNAGFLSGLPVLHSISKADEVIVSIGSNRIRREIAERIGEKVAGAVIHTSAIISDTASIGNGSVVMAGTVVNADAIIGQHCIINTGATVDHECQIRDYVHIAPGVHLCGQVQIGEGTLIGVGSSVIPCVKIGCWCVIGAGSVVVNDIPDGYLAYGNPCKLVKLINEDMIGNVKNLKSGGGKSYNLNSPTANSRERRLAA